MTDSTATTKRAALVAGLRALADDLERSTAPLPTHVPVAQWLIFGEDGIDQKATAVEIVRDLSGHWDKGKHHTGAFFDFTRSYGGGVEAQVVVDRPQVCERIVTGTEPVTIPAVQAQPERTETREIVEWRCQPLLADEQVPA